MKLHLFLYLFCFLPHLLSGQVEDSPNVRVSLITDDCEYSSARFEATVNGFGHYTCHWFRVGELRDIPLGDGVVYEIPSLRRGDAGSYYCAVTNPASGESIKSALLELNVSVLEVYLPDILNVSEREKFTLLALDADGNSLPASKIKWYLNGTVNKTGNSFTALSTDMYIQAIYLEGTCSGTASTDVFVKPRKLFRGGNEDGFSRVSLSFQVEIMVPSVYCENEELAFRASARGDAGTSGFTFRWWKVGHGYDLLISERQNFFLSPSKASDAGDYYCEVRDQNGFRVLSDTQSLVLSPVRIGLDPDLCYATQGERLTFKASYSDGDTISNDSLDWYQRAVSAPSWTVGKDNRFVAGAGDSYFKAVYTNSKGCTAEDSSLIITRAHKNYLGGVDDGFAFSGAGFTVTRVLPVAKLHEFCDGGSVIFRATVPEGDDSQFRFRWWKVSSPTNELLSDNPDFSITGLQSRDAGYYFCEARDNNGFSAFTDTVQLTSKRVVLPAALHAFAGERLSLAACDIHGNPVSATLTWRPSGLGTSNPLIFTAPASDMLVRVNCDFGEHCLATDSTWIYIHDKTVFHGGDNDGFDRTQIPPALTKPRLPELFCTLADTVSFEIGAMGSDLCYQWEYRLMSSSASGWADVQKLNIPVVGATTPQIHLREMPEELTILLRCKISNTLATIYSDTVRLYGHHLLQATVDKPFVTLYDQRKESVCITLQHGVMPWSFHYATPLNTRYQRNGLREATDLMEVSETGTYRLIYLRDSVGCELRDSLPEIKVSRPEIPEITISGDKEVCENSDVLLRLEIRNGVGPWRVWVDLDGSPATDPGLSWPLTITGRDTSLLFQATRGGTYAIAKIEDLNSGNGNAITQGITSGSASIILHMPDLVRFATLTDNHVGSCRNIDLFSHLGPYTSQANQMPANGSFYVNGTLIPVLWTPVAGEHTVRYVQKMDAYGCSGNAEVTLIADPLPGLTLYADRNVCENTSGDLQIHTVGNKVDFQLIRKRTDRFSMLVSETVSQIGTSELGDNNYSEAIRFMVGDSCLIYTVRDISDKHGCVVADVLSDTVYSRESPQILLQSRYPDQASGQWESLRAVDTIYTWGDATGIRAIPDKGVNPVDIKCEQVDHPGKGFNINNLHLTDAGIYRFSASDRYCSNSNVGELTLIHLKPLYMRLKVLLEGLAGNDYKEITVDLVQNNQVVGSAAFLARGDGMVVDQEGNSVLSTRSFLFTSPLAGDNFDIIVRSEGYLAVRGKKPFQFSDMASSSMLIDLTDSANLLSYDGDLSLHATRIGERDGKAIWALSTVEANDNDLISVKDANGTLLLPSRFINTEDETRRTLKNRDKYSGLK